MPKSEFSGSQKVGDSIITSTSTEWQKCSQNLAPVLVIISLGILWYFLGKLLPVLGFTGAAPPDLGALQWPFNNTLQNGAIHRLVLSFTHVRYPILEDMILSRDN